MNSTLYTPPAQSIRAVIEHFAASQPAQVFVRFPETGEQLTYAQLLEEVRLYVGYFAALDVKRGIRFPS
ncbi:hypothetical protein [Aliamphritea spongicola]|nr:hypothetical protein [Aliamphritea spongicola]